MASRAYTTHRVDIKFTRSGILSSRDDAKRLSDGESLSGSWCYTVRNCSSVRSRWLFNSDGVLCAVALETLAINIISIIVSCGVFGSTLCTGAGRTFWILESFSEPLWVSTAGNWWACPCSDEVLLHMHWSYVTFELHLWNADDLLDFMNLLILYLIICMNLWVVFVALASLPAMGTSQQNGAPR